MSEGTKELNELLVGIELLLVSGKKIAKDGVSLADLPEAIELVRNIDTIIEAVKDADKVGEEVKDLDESELLALGLRVFKLFKAVKSA